MQYLTQLSSTPEASWYAVDGDYNSAVKRYVVSTAESRAICNRPELVGCEYTNHLEAAVTKAFSQAPFRQELQSHEEHRVCVLNFLRGGLNFGIRGALHTAFGMNRHTSAFMSSQRSKTSDGRWQVREDMYRKLEIPSGSFIIAGDVVATGITMENGLDVLVQHLESIASSIRHIVFFTIGCHKLEKVLSDLDTRLRATFSDYESAHAVYFEGKFKLVDSKTKLRIGIQGTDLIRSDSLIAPEFEASQWDDVAFPLERCTIYDAGSRAFDVPRYIDDVLEYWEEVATLASQGLSLNEAIEERFPTDDYASLDSFLEKRRCQWKGIDQQTFNRLYRRYLDRWADGPANLDSAEALAAVCERRIQQLKRGDT